MKIEAEKYYRTRGGERVGPAKRDVDHGFADQGFVWRVGCLTYRDDGRCTWSEQHKKDIVAEWGEAVTPKFQPGDLVRCLQTSGSFTRGKVYTVRSAYGDRIRICEDDKGSATNGWLAEKFERVDSTTQDSPTTIDNPCIKTVTRREVVPGRLLLADGARIEITKVSTGRTGTYVLIGGYAFTAAALREAAAAFNEIADALDGAGQ